MDQKWGVYRDLLIKGEEGFKLKKQEELKEWVPDWFTYHQLNDRFKKDGTKGFSDSSSELETKLLNGDEKLISKMYKLLLEWETKDELVKSAMTQWARDVGHNIEFTAWERLWRKDLKFTACYTLRENFMKMIYRWYLTPVKLAKMYRNCDNTCWKCRGSEGSFFHMWWACRKASGYWEIIYNELKKILKFTVPKKPEAFLLGIVGSEIPKKCKKVYMYAITAARILYAQRWKQEETPSKEEWLQKMMEFAEMAKLMATLRDQEENIFYQEWKCFADYIRNHYGHVQSLAGFQL